MEGSILSYQSTPAYVAGPQVRQYAAAGTPYQQIVPRFSETDNGTIMPQYNPDTTVNHVLSSIMQHGTYGPPVSATSATYMPQEQFYNPDYSYNIVRTRYATWEANSPIISKEV